MENLETNWGETFDFLVEVSPDSGSDTAELLIADEDGNIIITSSGTFVDNIVDLSVDANDMEIEIGVYTYQVNITYDDGRIKKFPNEESNDCDEGCDTVTLTVCATVDMDES